MRRGPWLRGVPGERRRCGGPVLSGGEKISGEIKTEVEAKIQALKDVKEGTDREAIKRASSELSTAMQKIGEAVYKDSPTPTPEGENPNDTREAEFREKPDETPE